MIENNVPRKTLTLDMHIRLAVEVATVDMQGHVRGDLVTDVENSIRYALSEELALDEAQRMPTDLVQEVLDVRILATSNLSEPT